MAAASFQTSHPNSTLLLLLLFPINMASRLRHTTVDTHTHKDHVKTSPLHGNQIPWQPVVWVFSWAGLGERRGQRERGRGGEMTDIWEKNRNSGKQGKIEGGRGSGGAAWICKHNTNTDTFSFTVLRSDKESETVTTLWVKGDLPLRWSQQGLPGEEQGDVGIHRNRKRDGKFMLSIITGNTDDSLQMIFYVNSFYYYLIYQILAGYLPVVRGRSTGVTNLGGT